ncbi:OprO/OprP family phosphate-selective porin [Crenalkalicoccus roseus]|uniref:OprO/OprP family phosphate-selective porin n=1 Tax=Crenalkalicoccus roseus TaxID=1485588 RepID=UPI001305228F|nr:porin [Crenalkalicoccus roseus]
MASRAGGSVGLLVAGALLLPPRPLGAEEGKPQLRLFGDTLTLRPTGLLQLDAGSVFGRTPSDAPDGGLNPRRLRLGLQAEWREDLTLILVWDFGGTPGSRSRLHEASIAYSGLDPFTLTVGVFRPRLTLEGSQRAAETLFLERAAIVGAASSLAAGSGRVAAELRAEGERWMAAAALTGGRTGPGEDSTQRGATARLAGLPVRREEGPALHLGLSASWSFRPPRGGLGRAVELSEPPELALDRTDPPLDTGAIRAGAARSGGVEAGLAHGRLWAQGEWHGIAVERAGGGTLRFSGWYAQAAWALIGQPREWEPTLGAWGAPKPSGGFDPAAGRWGAVEIGARYSVLDLNDGDIRGGRQRVWSAGLGWWPVESLRLLAQYQYGQVRGGGTDRSFQALALRAQWRF